MLEEFAITLQVMPPHARPVAATVAPATDSTLPMHGPLADQATSGLCNATPATGDAAVSPLPSALLTPPRESQPGVACGDETPTPLEAARRLARFLDEVRVEREPPLVASPPRQRTPVRRPPPLRPRSSRIAAQPLAHIPASRRGEVLLNKRLGIASPTAPVSPAPRGILDALRSGTLSASEVEALDALFPAFKGRACELFQEDS